MLGPTDVIETFYNDYHMGLVVYRDRKPWRLIGFWDPQGNSVRGGSLDQGAGIVLTPFNPELIPHFKNETVTYEDGLKNGYTFYYCECASVLRRGTFTNNQKSGLWMEFTPQGDFVKQEDLDVPDPPVEVIGVDRISPPDKKWLEPAHCMMCPDEVCPNPLDK